MLIFGIFSALSLAVSLLTMHSPSLMMFLVMGLWMLFNTVINAVTYTSYYDIIRSSLTKSMQGSIEHLLGESKHHNDSNDPH